MDKFEYQGFTISNGNIGDFEFTPNDKIGQYKNSFKNGQLYEAIGIKRGWRDYGLINFKNNVSAFLWRFDIRPKIKAVNE